jgi:pyrimidine operon attenuation protein/uracil phosphoribosyltransferase
MRNGLQDYEYLWMLEDKISRMKAGLSERLSIIEPSRRGVEIASQVVRSMDTYTKAPNELYAAKKQIIEELLDLDRAPRVIVQTKPPEHTPVGDGCAIDLYGWAEPRTRVTVGGREIPVAADGLFMENVRLSRDNTIVVMAENNRGKKIIVRTFRVLH